MRDDTASRRSAAEVAAGRIVEEFLDASMIPDPVRARTYMAPDVKITFTGGRKFNDPAGTAAFNAARYRVVKKKFERTDVVAGGTDEESIVYNTGTLYGQWPNGDAFEVQRNQQAFGFHAVEADIRGVRNPAVDRTTMFRPSPSEPSWRVTMFTTPLIASVP